MRRDPIRVSPEDAKRAMVELFDQSFVADIFAPHRCYERPHRALRRPRDVSARHVGRVGECFRSALIAEQVDPHFGVAHFSRAMVSRGQFKFQPSRRSHPACPQVLAVGAIDGWS